LHFVLSIAILYIVGHPMNFPSEQKSLSWFDERICEAEARVASDKQRLDELEARGLNTSQACRELAVTAEYLYILKVRRGVLLEESSAVKHS